LTLPAIFSDNLVLQSGKDTPVFGWAAPGASVQVHFVAGKTDLNASALADKDGKWLARLPELPVGLVGELIVKSGKDTRTFSNALIGEVWLCGGQSNMFWVMGAPVMTEQMKQTARDEAAAAQGKIRMFRVKRVGADTPQSNVEGEVGYWEVITPANVARCSAVAWNFAERILRESTRPVGLISASWGGTTVEAWMSKESLDSTQAGATVHRRHEAALENWEEKFARYEAELKTFEATYQTPKERLANKAKAPRPVYTPSSPAAPKRLYNAMIHPLEPYGLAGMIWFQGESNEPYPRVYGELVTAMLNSYRERFGRMFAFYYVELANLSSPQTNSKPCSPCR